MKIWLIIGVIALIAVLAVSGFFLAKNIAKADTSTTGNVVSSGCGCSENCACGCKGQCTAENDCGCLSGKGCSAQSGGSCGCKK